MILIWYILAFIILLFLVVFLRKRYSNADSKTENIKAKKEDFNPEFSSEKEEGKNTKEKD